ncbi:MAG: 3-hydroxyacyl-[acyl-carrier-protein] dehydratase, FabZ form, partial [uncultured Thermomicrobiales bacterium]
GGTERRRVGAAARRGRNPGDHPPPLPLPARRPDPGARTGEPGRRPEERHRWRALLRRPFSGLSRHAGRPDRRGAGPGRRGGDADHGRRQRQAGPLRRHRQGPLQAPGPPRRHPPPGGPDRPGPTRHRNRHRHRHGRRRAGLPRGDHVRPGARARRALNRGV